MKGYGFTCKGYKIRPYDLSKKHQNYVMGAIIPESPY